ncbi:hypothetical protein BGX30_005316 [Mortierella sp. GBA39]|nr:hypothetical protein BGX30_005316 [Mortierella sp. GBA39]
MEKSAWSCQWLRILHVQFGGIPRPNIQNVCRGDRNPAGTKLHSGTMEQSREVQRKVHAQLAILECLEELYLRRHSPVLELVVTTTKNPTTGKFVSAYNDPGLQQTCLEWTLASELELPAPMRSMRSMRLLGLEIMEHRIDLGDLKWMQRHWPRMFKVEVGEQPQLAHNNMSLVPVRQA